MTYTYVITREVKTVGDESVDIFAGISPYNPPTLERMKKEFNLHECAYQSLISGFGRGMSDDCIWYKLHKIAV